MNKLVKNAGINITGSLKSLEAGESLIFPTSISETVVRSTCSRVKNTIGATYKVNRQQNGSHIVTRIA